MTAAIDGYKAHLEAAGQGERTIVTTMHRLRGLLRAHERDFAVRELTVAKAKALFGARAKHVTADTQHGELAAARGLAKWCIAQGWLRADPFAALEPIGARARGKAKLRIDEARRFLEVALGEDSESGLAAALALLMGLRASEVTDRVVRDVDDGARVLWVERAKTRAGDRHLEIPDVLRPRIAALVAGRSGGDALWGAAADEARDRHWLGYHVRRICQAAKVPIVSPHGLRGTFGSIAAEATPVDQVSRALGHAGPTITRRHYLAQGAEHTGRQRAALRVLAGGQS